MPKVKERMERKYLKLLLEGNLDAEGMSARLGMKLEEFVRFTRQESVQRLVEDLAHAEDLKAQAHLSRNRVASVYGLLAISGGGGRDETTRKACVDVLKAQIIKRAGGQQKKGDAPAGVTVDVEAAAMLRAQMREEGLAMKAEEEAMLRAGEARRIG